MDEAAGPLIEEALAHSAPAEPAPVSAHLRALAQKVPAGIYLGTSSWNFPGWQGLVWSPSSNTRTLADTGLGAYSRYPLFRTVGIDRAFYRPLTAAHYRSWADQVPEGFRFLVKAPQSVTDAQLRDARGRPVGPNPDYLHVQKSLDLFVGPVLEGLADKAGPLVFEMATLPREAIASKAARQAASDAMAAFFDSLQQALGDKRALLAVEMRTPRLMTRYWVNAMRPTGVRPVIGLHPRMPSVMRQIEMLRFFDAPDVRQGAWSAAGDIVVRWSLHARGTFSTLNELWKPFQRIQAADIVTREGVAWLMGLAARSGVRGFAVANNKAEGCAPLTMRAIAQSLTGFRVRDDAFSDALF